MDVCGGRFAVGAGDATTPRLARPCDGGLFDIGVWSSTLNSMDVCVGQCSKCKSAAVGMGAARHSDYRSRRLGAGPVEKN